MLCERVLVHTAPADALAVAELIAGRPSGLVLAGAQLRKALDACRSISDQPLIIDQQAYAERGYASPKVPFGLLEDVLVPETLLENLQQQRELGATVPMTPTRCIRAGDYATLEAVVAAAGTLRADVVVALPLDVFWLTERHLDVLVCSMREITQVKAVFLGGQYNPPERLAEGFAAVRQLAQVPRTVLMRTDLLGFDFLSHGGLAASIGTSSRRRHFVPPGQRSLYGGRDEDPDDSPSVLVADLLTFVRGSTLANTFVSAAAPRCTCRVCGLRSITTWLHREDWKRARLHNVAVWTHEWLPKLIDQPSLAHRKRYWAGLCKAAIENHAILNRQLGDPEAFTPASPLLMWAEQPAERPASPPLA